MKKRLYERAWVRQTMDRYEEVEKQLPVRYDLDGELPDWVFQLNITLMGIFYTGLIRRPFKQWTAKELGYFLGRQSAILSFMCGEVPVSQMVAQETERCFASLEEITKLRSNPYWPQTQNRITTGMKKWRLIFKQFIDEIVIEARNRPYPEASAFLEAFGKANVIKPDELSNERKMGVSERIAWVMILFWRPISKYQSVAELHRLLSAAAKPMGIEIRLKRVEKLCQRIGLRFKGRGAPKKSKIQTNQPVLA